MLVADAQCVRTSAALGSKNELIADRLDRVINRDLPARTAALEESIQPLKQLYSSKDIAEVRRRAVSHQIPEAFVDWCLNACFKSSHGTLPTEGEAFRNCGPGTHLGRALSAAGKGTSKPTFARWLGILRQLLENKGLISYSARGSRRRASGVDPSTLDDPTQLNPYEAAAEGQQIPNNDTDQDAD